MLRVLNLQADFATLRAIETAASNGDASHHVVSCYLVNQFRVCLCHVGGTFHGRPIHVLFEGFLHWQVADIIPSVVIVEQAVKADALDGGNESARRRERLQAAASADTHDGEGTMFILLSASLKVDVGKGIQFGHHNVNIVAADARREHGDTFTLISSCNAVELSAAHFTFLLREVRRNGRHSARVADQNHAASQLFGTQMEVERRAIFVDGQFGWRESFLRHGNHFLRLICPQR